MEILLTSELLLLVIRLILQRFEGARAFTPMRLCRAWYINSESFFANVSGATWIVDAAHYSQEVLESSTALRVDR